MNNAKAVSTCKNRSDERYKREDEAVFVSNYMVTDTDRDEFTMQALKQSCS